MNEIEHVRESFSRAIIRPTNKKNSTPIYQSGSDQTGYTYSKSRKADTQNSGFGFADNLYDIPTKLTICSASLSGWEEFFVFFFLEMFRYCHGCSAVILMLPSPT